MKKLVALFLCLASGAVAQTAYSPDSRPHSAHATLSSITHPQTGLNFNGVNLVGAPNLLSIVNGGSPQYLNIYGATGTNAEYAQIGYSTAAGPFTINTNKSGTGVTDFRLQIGGVTQLDYNINNTALLTVGNISNGKVSLANELYVNNGPVWIPGTSAGLFFTTNGLAGPGSTVDTSYCRVSAGIVQFGGSTCGKTATVQLAALQASGGSAPTINTGTCSTVGTWVGGTTNGKFPLTAACAAGTTIIVSGLPTSAAGYNCEAWDQSQTSTTMISSADSTTSCTLTFVGATTGTTDSIHVHATGY